VAANVDPSASGHNSEKGGGISLEEVVEVEPQANPCEQMSKSLCGNLVVMFIIGM
jgi:hypothetical protein